METTKFTQNEDAEMYPVAAKEAKRRSSVTRP